MVRTDHRQVIWKGQGRNLVLDIKSDHQTFNVILPEL